MQYRSKFASEKTDAFFEAILALDNLEDCYRFFEDVCTAAEIVGDFMTEILGEEMKPWQNAENEGTGASI